MFEGFANVWTPVALSRAVRRKPVPVEVAGEKLVLFRGASGEVGALLDRCPHRGVALSTGKCTAAGNIQCPYHAYEYATDGRCMRITLHPDAKRERMSAIAVPVRERAGLIWIYTAAGAEPTEEPFVPPGISDPSLTHFYLEQEWSAHWGRVIENMLDTPHLPYVHGRSIGFPLARREKPGSRIQLTVEDTAEGSRSLYDVDGFRAADDWLEFTRPNRMSNRTVTGKGILREFNIWAVPRSPTRTRLIVATARGFGRHNPLFRIFDHLTNRLILKEDRPIVEAQTPVVLPPPGEERSVAGDAHTLRFRRYYFEHLHHSSAPNPRRVAPVPAEPDLPKAAVGD